MRQSRCATEHFQQVCCLQGASGLPGVSGSSVFHQLQENLANCQALIISTVRGMSKTAIKIHACSVPHI